MKKAGIYMPAFFQNRCNQSSREQRLHFLQGIGFQLADAFGGYPVFIGQFMQRGLVLGQESLLQDFARTHIQTAQTFTQQFKLVVVMAVTLLSGSRVGIGGDQIGRR
jgi:hypothetical protein